MNEFSGTRKLAYTVEEVSDLISISRAQLYRLIDIGELSTIKIGRSRRITLDQLQAFLRCLEGQGGHPGRSVR